MLLHPPRRSFLGELPRGEGGTRNTLSLMRDLVRRFKRAPEVRETALSLIAELPPKDRMGEARAIFRYVQESIRYVNDIQGLETLQTPLVTMDVSAGDCDDKSVLLASLLESIGRKTRFVAVGYSSPGSYSHVYVEALINENWVPMDATVLRPLGWAPRASVTRMVVPN